MSDTIFGKYAEITYPDGRFYSYVLRQGELQETKLMIRDFTILIPGWYLSRSQVMISELFQLFMPGATFDYGRPQYWNDLNVGKPAYDNTVWLYDKEAPIFGRPFNVMVEFWPKLIDLALTAHQDFHAKKEVAS